MPSVGERLRAERERRRQTVQQASDATNIKSDHVRALEEGRWDAFAAPVYIRGFVRTYARHLRLDDREIMQELDGELGGRSNYGGPPELAPRRKGPLDMVSLWLSRAPWPWIFPAAVGVAAAIAIILAVRYGRGGTSTPSPIPEIGSPLYQPKKVPTHVLPLPGPATNALRRAGSL